MRDDRERLSDVLEAIERIEKYAVRGREALAGEELLQTCSGIYLDRFPIPLQRSLILKQALLRL
jgi:hypothetical protein